ncbi:Thioredoxin [Quillaja saponaria]|uniref:Thioredoxin n=1 Tax=Quillaja saponaria TaxID=32244 RepID=A0AAD7VNV4_QUISA|nr:Thioredoxin [Quillaja saponaria]KAJ7982404.1 Thioredoxin [Quillaja saponaria]
MSLLHFHTPHFNIFTLSPIFTSSYRQPYVTVPHSFLKTHQQYSLFSTNQSDNNRPSSLSTLPRKLLCKPPQGKYVREDYLVKKFSAQEVQELVRGERNVPLIIDFYATWCGPCILMAQELEMLAVEYESNAMIIKVDTDDDYEFARDMQVRGLPTLFFISPDPNKDAIRTEGLIPIQMMRDIIDNEM